MAGRKPKPETKIIVDYIERFPDALIRPLARKIMAENPGIFKDIERVMGTLRYYTGTKGVSARSSLKDKLSLKDKI